jgi:Ca2+-transporting ATPase
MLFALPLPLSAVQLLYVNLLTDGLPALALAVDPHADDLMTRRPHRPGQSIFSRPVVALMLVGGVWSAIVNVALFGWALSSGRTIPEAMTMTFVSLVTIQFFKAYSFRSERRSIFVRPFENRWLKRSVLGELVFLVVLLYVPVFRGPFGVYPLTVTDWVIVSLVAVTIIPVLEVVKALERRGVLGKTD